jgi:hypothetical protein
MGTTCRNFVKHTAGLTAASFFGFRNLLVVMLGMLVGNVARPGRAQTPVASPAFDVATIKPGRNVTRFGIGWFAGDRFIRDADGELVAPQKRRFRKEQGELAENTDLLFVRIRAASPPLVCNL